MQNCQRWRIVPGGNQKSVKPYKPSKNFNVLEKYNMPIKRGMIIDNAEKIHALNDNAFIFPVSLLGI